MKRKFDQVVLITPNATDKEFVSLYTDNNVFIERTQAWLGYYYRWHPDQATWQMRKDNINYDLLIQNKSQKQISSKANREIRLLLKSI